ncbi:hypothetical protein V6N13_101661 [Hibiscus sabdariffa]|uniref:Uncharacterized protein n=1 Tax=Hibiscus sabdariffa TaxID=183260 RepID=A0ABR2QM06_9ROSI
MFNAWWDERVRRERENKGSNGRRSTESELVGEVEKGKHVALSRVWEHQEVTVRAGGCGHCGQLMASAGEEAGLGESINKDGLQS